jgi:protein-S-isoprenylcysteine O-methyltransferase Ste14
MQKEGAKTVPSSAACWFDQAVMAVESYGFQFAFIYFAFHNLYYFIYSVRLFLLLSQSTSSGVVSIGWASFLSDLMLYFVLVFYNCLIAFGLFVRRNLWQRPQGFQEIVIPIIGTFGMTLFNLVPYLRYGLNTFSVPENYSLVIIAGTSLALAGLVIAAISIYQLRRSFGILVQVRDLVTDGLFHYIRHPMYLGHLIAYLGFLLIRPSVFNLVLTVTVIALNFYRAFLEEKKLQSYFPQYAAYKRVTPFIIPRLKLPVSI